MSAKSARKVGFRDYLQALKQVGSSRSVSSKSVFLISGKAPWLMQEAVRTLRDTARKADLAVATLDGKEVNEAMTEQMFSQSSLFEPATLYVIQKAETAKALCTRLGKNSGPEIPTNKFALVFSGEKVPAAFASTGSHVLEVPCFAPWANEMAKAVEAFAEIQGLKLDNGAVQVMLETLGTDLQKIHNELVRVSMHYGNTSSVLGRNEIAPFLGALKEEDIYQLDRYLLERKWALANSLVLSMLSRGEKPLSILAMLTSHCRNVLEICDGLSKGLTLSEISSRSRMRDFVLKNYMQSARNAPVPVYAAALAACHRADRQLKSTPIEEGLLLSRVISTLSEQSARA